MIDIPKRFPHLLPPDVPVLIRWITLHQNEINWIDFDVRVGEGRPAPEGTPANLHQMALDLSKRRIDVVAGINDKIIIVEVTRVAGFTALGQLLTYPSLYKRSFNPNVPIEPLLICEEVLPDVLAVLIDMGIKYEILKET
jgi:hypothetical protein